MQQRIDNDASLTHAISVDLRKAVESLADAIVELIKGYVESEVYEFPHENTMYKRESDPNKSEGEGFYHSWVFTDIEARAGVLGGAREFKTKIFSDPSLMAFYPDAVTEPEVYVHGGGDVVDLGDGDPFVTNRVDRREYLDAAIAEGIEYDFPGGSWAKPRDYWTPVVDLMRIGMFGEMFEQSFRNLGVRIRKKE